jgi:hypothetical protein
MKYYLIKTDIFPHEFADGESVILIHDEEGADDFDESDLEFMTTLVINAKDVETPLEEFSSWWYANTTGKFELELLTDEIAHLNEERRAFVASLGDGELSLKGNFMAYVKSDVESQKYAKEIIIESELQVQ